MSMGFLVRPGNGSRFVTADKDVDRGCRRRDAAGIRCEQCSEVYRED